MFIDRVDAVLLAPVDDLGEEEIVGQHDEERQAPAHHQQPPHPLSVVPEGVHEEELEVGALAQHPEVGGQGGVGGRHVQRHAPRRLRVDVVEGEDEGVVEQPRRVTTVADNKFTR